MRHLFLFYRFQGFICTLTDLFYHIISQLRSFTVLPPQASVHKHTRHLSRPCPSSAAQSALPERIPSVSSLNMYKMTNLCSAIVSSVVDLVVCKRACELRLWEVPLKTE